MSKKLRISETSETNLTGLTVFLYDSEIRLDWIILPNCKETTTNSIKLRFDESSRAI